MSDLLLGAALGVAFDEVDHRIREVGGNNRGPRIEQYRLNADPPFHVAVPWCALFVQYCTDIAARGLGVANPLDAVKLEAYVQSYYDWATGNDKVVNLNTVRAGHLVLFRFGSANRWNHIGLVARPPDGNGIIWTVEGNTSTTDDRDGDGVEMKPRDTRELTCTFVAWAA